MFELPQLFTSAVKNAKNSATQLISQLPPNFLGSLGVVLVLLAIGFIGLEKAQK